MVVVYAGSIHIAQTRPEIKLDRINEYDLQGRDWKFVLDKALHSSHSLDAHFVKCKIPSSALLAEG